MPHFFFKGICTLLSCQSWGQKRSAKKEEKAPLCRRGRAGDGIRTREYQLGRLMPYHLATPASALILPLPPGWSRRNRRFSGNDVFINSNDSTHYPKLFVTTLCCQTCPSQTQLRRQPGIARMVSICFYLFIPDLSNKPGSIFFLWFPQT